jgi:hypothetical protein
MKEELLKARGRLELLKRERLNLSLEGKGLLQIIREKLDPYEPNVAKLDIAEASALMRRLQDVHAKLRDADGQIAELEEAIGE